ncbi:hypothetical protein ACOSP7_005150 [Xanthoceras sorbifolium]
MNHNALGENPNHQKSPPPPSPWQYPPPYPPYPPYPDPYYGMPRPSGPARAKPLKEEKADQLETHLEGLLMLHGRGRNKMNISLSLRLPAKLGTNLTLSMDS